MKLFDTFVNSATHPLEYVWADHYLLDIFSVDEETRSNARRLWLTVLIDARTRCVIGLALLYEEPCIESIQDALGNAVWPKESLIKDWGIKGEWRGNGIPVQLFLDNAWAHHSHSLENLARAIGHNGKYDSITLVFRPPYMARYGALIERFFGNLSAKLKHHFHGKGAIQSSQPKHVRNAAREACLLYEDLYRLILQEIVNYQTTPHSSLGRMTPNEKWLEAYESRIPKVPSPTDSIKLLFWRMYPDTRLVNDKGISLFGLKYACAQLAKQPRRMRNGKAVEYSIRFQKTDRSKIAVFQADRFLCFAYASELRLPNGDYRQMSLAELKLAKEFDKSIGSGRKLPDLLKHLDDIDDTVNVRQKEQKRTRKAVERKLRLGGEVNESATNPSFTDAEKGVDYTELLAGFGKRNDGMTRNN